MHIVRRTFFAHFCAGEDGTSIRPTIDALRRANINPIMDYAGTFFFHLFVVLYLFIISSFLAEADIAQVDAKQHLQDMVLFV